MITRILTEQQLAEMNARNGAAWRKPLGPEHPPHRTPELPKKPKAKKAKGPPVSEHAEQVAVIGWWESYAATHNLDYRLLLAIPNGGQRHIAVATKLKAEGVRSGVPDLFLAVARWDIKAAGLWIELKGARGKPTHNQLEYADLLRRQGYHVVIAWGAAEAIRAITGYLTA